MTTERKDLWLHGTLLIESERLNRRTRVPKLWAWTGACCIVAAVLVAIYG